MIDMENKVVDTVGTAIRADSSATSFYSEPIEEIKSFPCVVIYESGNSVAAEHMLVGKIENLVNLRYTVKVYSNNRTGKKAEAKHLFAVIDNAMESMGFRRDVYDVVPNMDRTVHQIIGQYSGKVEKQIIGGNNVYTVYNS